MERLLQQGPMSSSYLLGEHLDHVEESYQFEQRQEQDQEEEEAAKLEEKMPFLQMLQSVESEPQLFPFKEASFQTLLKLQHLERPSWDVMNAYYSNMLAETDHQQQQQLTQVPSLDGLESCVTHDNNYNNVDVVPDFHSPVKSETKDIAMLINPSNVNLCPFPHPPRNPLEPTSAIWPSCDRPVLSSSTTNTKERKKRKRTRSTKNKEEVECQRMTHIAVERNRRRQMNDHLNSLRSLMPPSYVQRGDQASIVGGAIDFVKELEQLLHSLEAQKRMRNRETEPNVMLFTMSPNCGNNNQNNNVGEDNEAKVKRKSEVGEIEVTAMQNHVNLKIECQRRPGQLLRAIVALDELRLSVLHLNITSSQSTVLYSINLKIEEECRLRSADEVASAVHQIFTIMNGS